MPSDTLATQQLDQPATPAPAKRGRGRPTTYTPQLAARVCSAYASSCISLQTICRETPGFPHIDTVYEWLQRNPDFSEAWERARARRGDLLAEQNIEIVDNDSRDWEPILDKEGRCVGVRVDGEHVQRSTLRFNARKWLAGKLNPKRWGDNLNVQVSIGDELRKLVREANAEPLDVTPKRIEDKT